MWFSVSPLTKKRFKNFRRIRRAWWSLLVLGGFVLFCMCAELVCPCDPKEVVDPATLEKYRKPATEVVYEIKTARFTIPDGEGICDYEGPAELRERLGNIVSADAIPGIAGIADEYVVKATRRPGRTRVFLEPKTPPKETLREIPAPPVSFPFRPCFEHPFGLDASGRDVYARVVYGMRIALLFGFMLAFWAMLMGLVVGAIEGYFGGTTDIALQRFTEIWSAVPFIYVMIFIGSTLGRSFTVLLVCYAIFNWIGVSYYMRAEFLRLRSRPFVESAKVQGFSATRIIFGHILPNAMTPLITLFPFLLIGAIGSLAALDFLGFGLPPMTPSCGELMHEAQQFRGAWWLVLFPAAALFAVMLLSVLVGEGLRDAFDPRQKSRLE